MHDSLLDCFKRASDVDDISKPPALVELYERRFAPLRGARANILEVGNYKGHFLKAMDGYFESANIIGLDVQNRIACEFSGKVKVFECNQGDCAAVTAILNEHMMDGIDIVIDDASHVGSWSASLYKCVFERWVKPGGVYFVEDWQTGYWPDWADGLPYAPPEEIDPQPFHFARRIKSHDAGMVGFIKTLVDEVGSTEWRPPRESSIEEMIVRNAVVEIRKKASAPAI